MGIFSKNLRDQAMKIINHEKKEMITLTNEEKGTHENQKICYIYVKKNFVGTKIIGKKNAKSQRSLSL